MRVYGLKCLVDQEIGGNQHKAGEIIQVHMVEEVLKQQLPHVFVGQTSPSKPTLAVVDMEAVELR